MLRVEQSELRPKSAVVWGDLPKDETSSGFKPGGPGFYIAIVYEKLGINVTVISCIGLDYPKEMLPSNLKILPKNPGVQKSMIYRNIYGEDGHRIQYAYLNDCVDFPSLALKELLDDAGFLLTEDQELLFVAPLRPVSPKLVSSICKKFPQSTKVGLIQGWGRQIEEDGKVTKRKKAEIVSDIEKMRGDFEIIIFSDEDFDNALECGKDWSMVKIGGKAPILVVTENVNGCTIFTNGVGEHIPAYKIKEITDPTGAGDRFAAFFAYMYRITGDPIYSARFANAGTAYALQEGNGSIQLEKIFEFAGDLI